MGLKKNLEFRIFWKSCSQLDVGFSIRNPYEKVLSFLKNWNVVLFWEKLKRIIKLKRKNSLTKQAFKSKEDRDLSCFFFFELLEILSILEFRMFFKN